MNNPVWKTARTALNRIQESFKKVGHTPYLFFIGAAIEAKMAIEMNRIDITPTIP